MREALQLCAAHLRYAFLFSALVNLAYLAPTFYMLAVYDMILPSGDGLSLVFVSLALALTLVVLTTLDRVRTRVLAAASMRLDNVFASRIFRRAISGSGRGLQPRLNQVIREFDNIRAAATGPAALAMFDAPWIPIYIAVCFCLHWSIGALALGGSIVLLGLAVWNERTTRPLADQTLQANAASFARQEAVGGSVDVIRAMGMTEAFVAQLELARARANLPQMQALYAGGRVGGLIRLMRLLLQSAALGLGALLAMNKQISGGAVFAASMLATRALSPIDQIVAQWRTAAQALSAYGAVRQQITAEPELARTALPAPAPRLTVANLGVVTPQRDRAILGGISFAVDGGKVLGVVGPSGAGKSTLLQALANARLPDQGEIRLDGASYADWDDQALGRHIGYLPQDCILFPGTVKDNISRFDIVAGGDAARIDRLAVEAAKAAGAHEMILSLPGGYDARLGPRGQGLSAGQQQRVALARALYGDPVLFVLDEPNANLDSEGEVALAHAIDRLRRRGALIIVATHRLNLVAGADLLAVVRAGRLERFGPRQQVLDSLKASPGPGPQGPRPAAPPPPRPSDPETADAAPPAVRAAGAARP